MKSRLRRTDVLNLRGRVMLTAAWVGFAFVPQVALAQATAPTVAAGQATVSGIGTGNTVIRQSSEKAILNWPSLSVLPGSVLQYVQPNGAAIALNRVLGGGPSYFGGSLLANGQVWIINPNGVLFGAGASVNVAGLIATTSDIRDQDFLNGNYSFGPSSNPNASVNNAGTIIAKKGGSVVLAAPQVANEGVIEAKLGSVVLGGANAFTVDFDGDKLLSFAVTAPVTQTPQDANGNPAAALVANSGTIKAEGGKVLLTARAARDVIDNVINTTGMISATTAREDHGEIVLDAGPNGTAEIGGTVDVSGKATGQTGGTVEATGNTVAVGSDAVIDASGNAGGGTVLLGGNAHGAGPLPNATTTLVSEGAKINADAVTKGNGGNVVVWSDGHTIFDGATTVRGGAQGGNGGFVETSGKGALSVLTGSVDALAPQGQAGTWLLDPANITVQDGGTALLIGQLNGTLELSVSTFISSDTANYFIDPSTVAGATANVVLMATGNITFDDPVTMLHNGIALTVNAGNSILANPGAAITTNSGNIQFTANTGTDATGSGGIVIAAPISTAGGGQAGGSVALAVNGGSGTIALAQNITTDAGAISLAGPTVLDSNVTLDATDGGAGSAGGAVSFAGTIDGAQNLTINAGHGAIALPDAIGSSVPLAGLTATGSTISFAAPVAITGALNTSGVGQTTLAISLNVGSVSTGVVALDGVSVTTTGGQSYGAATLGSNTVLTDNGGSAITFGSSLTGGGNGLTVNDGNGGTLTFAGAVSGIGALNSTGTSTTVFANSVGAASVATGAVSLDGANVTTAGTQSYGAATLGGDTVLAGPIVAFGATVTGAHALTVTGNATFNGAVTVAQLSVSGSTALDGASVTTTNGQTYMGAATLGTGVTLADSGSAITFGSSLTGGGNGLTVNDGNGGTLTFAGAVSGIGALNSTGTSTTVFANTVTAASVATGAVSLDGANVTTAGTQSYGAATLGTDATLTDTDEGAITFAGTLDGTHVLTIKDAGGAITFDGAVGHTTALASLSAAGAAAAFDGTVTVSGALNTAAAGLTTFDNAVTAGSVATGAVTLDGGSVATSAGQSYGA
ncbi:MAG TPA: filamentous hemagglutinin N-terminal domain-containing protein, partial [Stellaceae bacterium]|nr:filamentous hemagglutinin N-terminal domain-containing protein [Stellaceae bacterium]